MSSESGDLFVLTVATCAEYDCHYFLCMSLEARLGVVPLELVGTGT